MRAYRSLGDGYEVTEYGVSGEVPLHREWALQAGAAVASYGLVKEPLQILKSASNPIQDLLLAEFEVIMNQRYLAGRKCTLVTRVLFGLVAAGFSVLCDYGFLNISIDYFNRTLLPSNITAALALYYASMVANAAWNGWVANEAIEQLAWKLKIRARGPLRGCNGCERLGVLSIFLLSIALQVIYLVNNVEYWDGVITIVAAIPDVTLGFFCSLFSFSWLLSRLFESRNSADTQPMMLASKMKMLALNKELLEEMDTSVWNNGGSFLRAIVELEDTRPSLGFSRLQVARRIIANMVAFMSLVISVVDICSSLSSIEFPVTAVQWIGPLLFAMQNFVFNYVVTSAFVNAVAGTFCMRSEQSMIKQFFPKLIAGISIPFFLIAAAAGLFDLMYDYPTNRENEGNFTTEPLDLQALNGIEASSAVQTGIMTILFGVFALREWLKMTLRCSVACKKNSPKSAQLNTSLNLLSAAAHVQSMSEDDVNSAINACTRSQL